MNINFCHIVPVSYLDHVIKYPVHLLLAHLIEENVEYRNFYINLKHENPDVIYHIDNSAFEMFKRGQPMYPTDKLLEMARMVGGTSIVMSDYPKEHWSVTVDAAKKLIPEFKAAGFKTFFCPQSELGDIDGLMKSYEWAIDNPNIDFIGVSILACPIALGINETAHDVSGRDEAYRMQRYLSRWRIFDMLDKRGMLDHPRTEKLFHCLGMTDGPREIQLLQQYHEHIFSWDSSTAIWHGINGIKYDDTPTGLRNGKFEDEVDFSIEKVDGNVAVDYNRALIDSFCRGW